MWALVENLLCGFPSSGGRRSSVHGCGSVHAVVGLRKDVRELHHLTGHYPALAFDHAYSLDQSMLHTRVGKALSVLISGDRNAAGHVLQLTELESTEREVSDAEALFRIAEAYAVLGDTGGALRVLGRSMEGGFFCYPYLARDPLLESIRSVPAFQSLLERARQRHEAFRRRFF